MRSTKIELPEQFTTSFLSVYDRASRPPHRVDGSAQLSMASDESRYITGLPVTVDAGSMLK